jgi:hypothetical protein
MARRDTLLYAGIGGALLVGLLAKKRPGSGYGGGTGPFVEGIPGGDMISYVQDHSGLVTVFTPDKAVVVGVPMIPEGRRGGFHDMVSKWQGLVDQTGTDFRLPSSMLFGVMWTESGGGQNVTHRNKNGSIDAGLMAINQVNWGGNSLAQMLNPETNMKIAANILRAAYAGFRDLPQVASEYNAGHKADGTPYTNADRPAIATRWGFAASPGYIDSVVAASNTYLKDLEAAEQQKV